MHLRIRIGLYVGFEVWLVVEYGAYHFFDDQIREISHIIATYWKNFTNIDRIVT